jgi:transglutaminase-like putative cysteine protease
LNEKGRELYRVRVDTVFSFRRLDDTVVMKMVYGTIETPEGEVLRLDTRTLTSDNEIRTYGDVVKGTMNLIMEGTGARQEKTIPWTKDIRGPYAAEQSMARKPMEDGESRSLKMYIPDLNRVVDIILQAGPFSDIALGDGSKRPLRKITQTVTLDGEPRRELGATLWADSSGQVLKSETSPALFGGMVMYRTTEEGATAAARGNNARFDQIRSTIIPVAKEIPSPRQTRYVQYRLNLKEDDPTKVFPTDGRQSFLPEKNPNSAVLNVLTRGPGDGEPNTAEVDAQYLRPNVLITSEDDRVQRLAKRAVGNARDPWDKAVRIEHWVFQNLRDKNFATAFAPANEVARNLSGDCSEHSVLAAAMCRAVGVPAKVAVGLIYMNDDRRKLRGFGFHMWHEVYVNQRWVALDASFDQTDVDAAHIKLADTSLEGVAPFEAFLPVLRVLGQLDIDPIELR